MTTRDIWFCLGIMFFLSELSYSQNNIDQIQIDILNSNDSSYFEIATPTELDSIELAVTAELNKKGELIFPIIYAYNSTYQKVYLFFDEIQIIDNLLHTCDEKISPYSGLINIYDPKREYEMEVDSIIPNKFPTYIEIDKENTKWGFSLTLKGKSFREAISNRDVKYAKIRFLYFLEEDLEAIENLLNSSIRSSKIQTRNFYTKFMIEIENRCHNLLDLNVSNSQPYSIDKMKIVFDRYIKSIETNVKIYDLFK